jgi:hypothetical protein
MEESIASLPDRKMRSHGVHAAMQPKQVKPLVTVRAVIKTQPGGAQSRLVRCSDGRLYILKMQPNPQGPNVLANEAIGATLLRGLGLPAPRWTPIALGLRSVRLFPELQMLHYGGASASPSCGLHFGSEYIVGAECGLSRTTTERFVDHDLAHEHFLAVSLFDRWACHQDKRQYLLRRRPGRRCLETVFIDNGHLFGGPQWRTSASYQPLPRHIAGANISVSTIVEKWAKRMEYRVPRLLEQAIEMVPRSWYVGDIRSLYSCLLARLAEMRSCVLSERIEDGGRIKAQMGPLIEAASSVPSRFSIRVLHGKGTQTTDQS